ncbi:hypothetical protein ACDT16_13805 [Staphylococcus aureus]
MQFDRARAQGPRQNYGHAFSLAVEDVETKAKVIACMVLVATFPVVTLFDIGATHSFIATS